MLASGSSGNAALVATERTRILIDAGLSVKELTRRLALAGEEPARLSAVLVTHEHSDHVAGLARLVRRYPDPGLHHSSHCPHARLGRQTTGR